MSQLTHPTLSLPQHGRSHRALWLAATVATATLAAVVLILAIGGSSSQDVVPVSAQAEPPARADSGPEETGVAAAIGSRPVSRPDESAVASAIARR